MRFQKIAITGERWVTSRCTQKYSEMKTEKEIATLVCGQVSVEGSSQPNYALSHVEFDKRHIEKKIRVLAPRTNEGTT